MAFVQQLYKVFVEGGDRYHGILRNKNVTCPRTTDVQLFVNMAMGDIWEDAGAASAYFYLRGNRYLVVPDSWESAIADFDAELSAKVS